jgi:lambda family phage minor tail protein L
MGIPISHAVEGQKLTTIGFVDLYEIHMLSGARFFCKNNDRVEWQDKTYEGWAVQLTGVETSADEQESRPTMVLANRTESRLSMFSPFIESGELDGATVYRRRILRNHLDSNLNVAQTRRWIVTRITSMNDDIIALELRTPTEGTQFLVPARMYMPPEFPTVSLT